MGKPAARITDLHTCPMVTGIVPHVGGPISLGSFNVFTGKLAQARVGDMAVCVGPPDVIALGSTGVFVNKMAAARMGDLTAHGGVIVVGLPTVLIGEVGGGGGGGAPGPMGMGMASHGFTGGGVPNLAFADAFAMAQAQVQAAKNGTPFCEVCWRAAHGGALPLGLSGPGAFATANSTPPTSATRQSPTLIIQKYINLSPTLRHNIDTLMKWKDWTTIYGESGKGTYCDRETKQIVIDPTEDASRTAQALAHETGHALYKLPYVWPLGLSREQWIERMVREQLKDEGEATLVNIKIRNEIMQSGGDDIGISGSNSEKYLEIYRKYPKSRDRDKARSEIADIFSSGEHPSTDQTKTYYDYYKSSWDRVGGS